ncbi:hypothetical protein BT96DRAFT_1013331 [Gymnopus androsaceus JB14]|uniref:C2 domain-containing protein n=1 Tax=Gymnopus androsaceus JB14 TaxID=1447944 RepID=A0A6A4IJD5_9AGAR|nr:hypothetical protein BT96DRAFT_1013331 [Gymnopus androsaceus JB14]
MIQLLDMNAAASLPFCEDDCESSQRVQFHVVGTRGFLSPKSHGKKPSNAFVSMKTVGDTPKDKSYLTTSIVKCKSSDEPQWFDNLGPIWLSPLASITFQVKTRSKFSKTTTVLASTETYTLRKLRKIQGSMDRSSTIALPLRSATDVPTDGVVIINLRELSSSTSGMEEYIKSAGSQRSSIESNSDAKSGRSLPPFSPISSSSGSRSRMSC